MKGSKNRNGEKAPFSALKKNLWCFLILLPLIVSCSQSKPGQISSACSTVNSPCLQGKAFVQIDTTRGAITFELDGDAAPVTAGNFLELVNKGVYNQTLFHRVIKSPMPFVAQGGDPVSKDPNTSPTNYGTGNFVDPTNGQARFIPLEIKLKSEEGPRYNRLITNPSEILQLQLIHQKGSLAMARSQSLDSASAQFYIALKSLPELDGRYAVFGRVIDGIDSLDAIEQGDTIYKAKILNTK